jgi:hypothetical protein
MKLFRNLRACRGLAFTFAANIAVFVASELKPVVSLTLLAVAAGWVLSVLTLRQTKETLDPALSNQIGNVIGALSGKLPAYRSPG